MMKFKNSEVKLIEDALSTAIFYWTGPRVQVEQWLNLLDRIVTAQDGRNAVSDDVEGSRSLEAVFQR